MPYAGNCMAVPSSGLPLLTEKAMPEPRRISAVLLTLAVALSACHSAVKAGEGAPDDTVRAIAAIHCNCGIKIDGIIDEPIWDSAPRSGGNSR